MTHKRAATRDRKRGQSMVEFALIAPTFFLMIFGIVEFGILMFNVASSRYAAGEAARIESYVGNTDLTCAQVKGCGNLGGLQVVQVGRPGTCDADCQAVVAINNSPVGTTSLETVLWVEIRQCPNAVCPNAPGSGLGTYNIRAGNDTCLSTDMAHCSTYPASTRSTSANSPEYLQVTLHYQYDWKTGLLKAIHNAPVVLDSSYLVRIEPQKF
jgi:Flp pilus assembly protein TadG